MTKVFQILNILVSELQEREIEKEINRRLVTTKRAMALNSLLYSRDIIIRAKKYL